MTERASVPPVPATPPAQPREKGERSPGVKLVSGNFARGDTVAILSPDGREIARGLVAYDAADAVRIAGLKTAEIETVLGYEARSAMIHRDDLVVSHAGGQGGE